MGKWVSREIVKLMQSMPTKIEEESGTTEEWCDPKNKQKNAISVVAVHNTTNVLMSVSE